MIAGGLYSVTALREYMIILFDFFDCWWAVFGNCAAENDNEGHSVY